MDLAVPETFFARLVTTREATGKLAHDVAGIAPGAVATPDAVTPWERAFVGAHQQHDALLELGRGIGMTQAGAEIRAASDDVKAGIRLIAAGGKLAEEQGSVTPEIVASYFTPAAASLRTAAHRAGDGEFWAHNADEAQNALIFHPDVVDPSRPAMRPATAEPVAPASDATVQPLAHAAAPAAAAASPAERGHAEFKGMGAHLDAVIQGIHPYGLQAGVDHVVARMYGARALLGEALPAGTPIAGTHMNVIQLFKELDVAETNLRGIVFARPRRFLRPTPLTLDHQVAKGVTVREQLDEARRLLAMGEHALQQPPPAA